MQLSTAQRAAIDHVRMKADAKRAGCHTNISRHLNNNTNKDFTTLINTINNVETYKDQNNHPNKETNILPNEICDNTIARVQEILEWIRDNSRITINFHPDRLCKEEENGWRTVAEALLEDNEYKCQFVTGISNGGLTAYPGGDRDRWEERMFGKSYHIGPVAHHERPRYGGLNIFNYLDGACPRFGSCHLRLRKHMLDYATFSYGDSVSEPDEMGVMDAIEPILASLLDEIATKGIALNNKITIEDFLSLVHTKTKCTPKTGRALDNYIETQIHSGINLATDVEAVVVDPSFRGSIFGEILQQMADKNNFILEWNEGFLIKLSDIPSDFRGPSMLPLAKRILSHFEENKTKHEIHTEMLGRAARNVVLETHKWEDWGNSFDSLQHIKYLWHTLVVYGTANNLE